MITQRTEGRLRPGATIAIGTVASRATGFLRTAVLAFALGTHALGDAYNTANTIPNIVYDLLLGGLLTSVVVPLLVRARSGDPDGGHGYEQRVVTLVVVALFGVTVAAVLSAGPLISLYGAAFTPAQHDLAVTLARFFLPQVFFYGVGAMAAAVLNTRGHFAASAWTPALNNVVVIGVGVIFLAVTQGDVGPATITPGETRLLAIGTTFGVVVQAAALYVVVRAAGFSWRPRLDFQTGQLAEIARVGAWVFAYVVTNQVGFAVAMMLANTAGVRARADAADHGAGFAVYQYSYTLFQLPYAIVAISVITAVLPQMSGHAAEGRDDLVRAAFSRALRLSSVLVVPAAMAFIALGPAIAVVLFGHGHTSVADAAYIGQVLRAFALGLVPFCAFQLLLRIFYAMHDTRTPALLNLAATAINIVVDVGFFLLLPARHVVVGLALGFGLSYAAAASLSWLTLRGRMGGLDGRRTARTLVLLHIAAIPGLIFAWAMLLAFAGTFGLGTFTALLAVVAGCGVGGLLYVLLAQRLGIRELSGVAGMVRDRNISGP